MEYSDHEFDGSDDNERSRSRSRSRDTSTDRSRSQSSERSRSRSVERPRQSHHRDGPDRLDDQDDSEVSKSTIQFCSKHKVDLQPDICNVCRHVSHMIKPDVLKGLMKIRYANTCFNI